MRFYRGPFGGGDAVNASVAQSAVARHLMAAQNAIELCPQPLDRFATLLVEKVCAELDRDAAETLKSMIEQQQFSFGVQSGALHAVAIPGRTDLHPLVHGIDVHICRHTHWLSGGVEDDS